MNTFFYQGVRIEPSVARIVEVEDQGDRFYIRVFDPKYHWFRIYYLPKSSLKRAPKCNEKFTSYEFQSNVVGCDFNSELQFRAPGLKEVI